MVSCDWSSDVCSSDLKPFMEEYAKMIAAKNVMLGSAGQLPLVKKALGVA